MASNLLYWKPHYSPGEGDGHGRGGGDGDGAGEGTSSGDGCGNGKAFLEDSCGPTPFEAGFAWGHGSGYGDGGEEGHSLTYQNSRDLSYAFEDGVGYKDETGNGHG